MAKTRSRKTAKRKSAEPEQEIGGEEFLVIADDTIIHSDDTTYGSGFAELADAKQAAFDHVAGVGGDALVYKLVGRYVSPPEPNPEWEEV